MIKDTPKEER